MKASASVAWQVAGRCGGRRERGKVLLIVLLLICTVYVLLMNPMPVLSWDYKEVRLWRDSRMFFNWEGFGPEKGQVIVLFKSSDVYNSYCPFPVV